MFTPVSIAGAAIAAAVVLANFVMVAMRFPDLPARIPSHFGLTGRPDAWHGKRVIWSYPAVSLGMMVTLAVALWLGSRSAGGSPPSAETEKVAVMAAFLAATMLFLTLRSIAVAEQRADGLGRWFLPALLVAVALIVVCYR